MEECESGLHKHCESCFRRFCSKHPDDCPIIHCSLHCGIRFHSCKADEHKLLCSKEKVPCINAGNGCPLEMPRYALAKHLGKCPASVVHCTMEWNRWPVYSKERSARVPFCHKNYHAKYGQLDVALALRDQRILNQAMQAPQRTKRALQNNLTPRFPAVPFTHKNSREFSDGSELSQTEEEEEEDPDAPWEVRKHPPGLASSVCTQLFQNDHPVDTLNTITELNLPSPNSGCDEPTSPEISSADVSNDNSVHFKNSQVHMTHETIQAMAMPKTFNIPQPPPLLLEELLALDLNVESTTRYQAKARSMYTFLCAQCFRRDEYAWHFQNVHCDIQGGLNGWFEQRCPLAHYGCTYSFHRFQPSQQSSSVVFSPLLESFGIRPMSQFKDFSEEQFNEYRMTRRSMSKEPTPEILTSVSYNSAVHVNGIRRPPHDQLITDYFTSLPFEVLQHIATFLDGYSLCNLSLCNQYLRDVCQSLLPERGHVVQEWEKNRSTLKWEITYQRWAFSTAFTSVPKWEFTKVDHLSKHLKECPVYKPYIRTDPFEMIRDPSHLMEDNPSFWRPLQAMYPDYNFKWSPTFIECLKEAEHKLKERKINGSSEDCDTGIASEF